MSAYTTSQAAPAPQRDANPLIPGHQTSMNPLAPHTAQNPITGTDHVSHNPLTQSSGQQVHPQHNTAGNTLTQAAGHVLNPNEHHTTSGADQTSQHQSINSLASQHHNTTDHHSSVPAAAAAGVGAATAAATNHHSTTQQHHSMNPLHNLMHHNKDVSHNTTTNTTAPTTTTHHTTHHNDHHVKADMAAAGVAAHEAHQHNKPIGTKAHWWNRRARMGRVEFGVREALSMLLVLGTMALTIWMLSLSRWASVPTVSGGTAHIGLRSDRITQAPGVAPDAQVDNTILAGGANFRRGGTAVIILGSLALACATLSILMFLCSLCRRANLKGAVALRRFTILMVFLASALITLAFLIYSYYLSADFAFIVFSLCSFLFTLAGLGLLAGAPDSVLHSHHSRLPYSSAKNLAATQPNTGSNTAVNSPRYGTAQMV